MKLFAASRAPARFGTNREQPGTSGCGHPERTEGSTLGQLV